MSYSYNYDTTSLDTSALAGLGIFFAVYVVICLGLSIFYLVSMWKVYEKAGKDGWAALIPIYNLYVLFEIGGQKGAYAFFIFIPFVGPIIALVFEIMAYMEIAKRFGKDTVFGVLSIFFPIVTFPILAFSDAKYNE